MSTSNTHSRYDFKFLVFLLLPLVVFCATFLGTYPAFAQWNLKGGTLSADSQGWAFRPTIAVDGSDIYACWTQHTNPGQHDKNSNWDFAGTYCKKWTGSNWMALGARMGHVPGNYDVGWPEGFEPSVAVLSGVPYVAWYEGGGYGWSTANSTLKGNQIFVAHWNGSAWVYDNDSSYNGALNTSLGSQDSNPFLAVIGGVLYCAFSEYTGSARTVVKHLSGGVWTQDGSAIANVNATGLINVGSIPYLLTTGPKVYKLQSGSWVQVGNALSSSVVTGSMGITVLGSTPYVAWRERTQTGSNQIHISHWTGAAWSNDGSSLNVDTNAEAGSPALTNDGTSVWLAWAESAAGAKSQLYVRSLTSGTWSSASSSLNVSTSAGAASRPALAYTAAVQVIWDERDFNTDTRQVYVRGNGDTGATNSDSLARYGADGSTPTIVDNTWTVLNPGGIATGSYGVGDEGYSTFAYDPITKKAYVWGKYHAVGISSGEDQNAILAYNYSKNRWDIAEIGEHVASEHIQGTGHDSGNATAGNGLFVSHGNLLSGFQTYIYDVRAGRGKGMTSNPESGAQSDVTTAYDPEHNIVFTMGKYSSWTYDFTTNAWTERGLPEGGITFYSALSYDQRGHVFVAFACNQNNTSEACRTWTFNPVTFAWTVKTPATMPGFQWAPKMAYDSKHGIHVMFGKCDPSTWIYDLAINGWSKANDFPAVLYLDKACDVGQGYQAVDGNLLTYDADDDVFLLHRGKNNLNGTLAFRYVPGQATALLAPSPVTPPPTPPSSTLSATYLGTDQDKVGPGNQTTPNGKADFHISVSGLRSTPAKVHITADTGGVWETPFNGTNWIIATQYAGTNGDFWFEQFASNNFTVKVTYQDGTTDTANAVNQVAIPPAPPPSPTPSPTPTPTPPNPTPTPTPTPLTTGSPLIKGQWFAMPVDTIGYAKHMTWKFDPNNQKLYGIAGDHGDGHFSAGLGAASSYRQEVYSIDLAEKLKNPNDPLAGMTLEHPYCGTAGHPNPKAMDYVGWTWDSTRNVFWMVSGERDISDHPPCAGETGQQPNGAFFDDPPNYYTPGHLMTFDPATKVWTLRGSNVFSAQNWDAAYDPVTDKIFNFNYDGGQGAYAQMYDIQSDTWTNLGGLPVYKVGNGLLAVDYQSRLIYAIDGYTSIHPGHNVLMSFNMDTHVSTVVSSTVPVFDDGTNDLQPQMVWDSVNHLLFYGQQYYAPSVSRMYVWDPKNPTVWTELPATPYNNPSLHVTFVQMAYDPIQQAVLAFGLGNYEGTAFTNSGPYMFVYRTGDVTTLTSGIASSSAASGTALTAPTPPPPPAITQAVTPTLPSTLKAVYLGVTGEDKVGPDNQTTPNGKPDFHIAVSGLRGTPNKVTITNDNNGIWETPFNGANWIIATQYDGKGNGDFWFEQYTSTKFHVKVRYADGTTDEADASKQASTPQPSPPPPSALTVAVASAPTSPSGIALSPPTDMIPPSVSFTYPSNGATVSGAISTSASASDNVAIAKVELYKDGVLVGSTTNASYSFAWDTTKDSNGFHTLIAMAYDGAANRASAVISVNVNNVINTANQVAPSTSLNNNISTSTVATLGTPPVAVSNTTTTALNTSSVTVPVSSGASNAATPKEVTAVLQDGLNGYGGTRDTHLYNYYHWLNFGSTNALTFGEWGSYDVLIRYAIFQSEGGSVPNGATIKSAVLSLYKYSAYDHTFQAHRLLKDWRETEASWDTANASTGWTIGGALGSDTDMVSSADGQGAVGWDPGWLAIDITSGLQALSNGASNYGWHIVGVSGDSNIIRFFSREYTTDPTLRPKLTIVYYADTVATAAIGQ